MIADSLRTAATRVDWLRLSAWLSAALAVVVVLFGADRSLWYDEVYTLGLAAPGRPLDWAPISADVHPPTYVLMVRALSALLPLDYQGLRLINVLGLLPLAAAIAIARRHLAPRQLALLAVLVLCSFYFLYFAVELRSYALIFCLSAWGHALLLDEIEADRSRGAHLILAATCLCMLHYFGAAIGLSLLGTSALRSLLERRLAATALRGAAILVLIGGVLSWMLVFSDTTTLSGGELWIRNDPAVILDFLAWQAPLPMLAILLTIGVRRWDMTLDRVQAARWLLLPSAVTVLTAIAISLHTPILSNKNLIVTVPGLSLAAVLVTPPGMLRWLAMTPLALLPVVTVGLRFADTATRNAQMIDWAVNRAVPTECVGAPLYMFTPEIVDRFAQELFLGGMKRPLRALADYDGDPALPPGCTVIGAGWHELGSRTEMADVFAARGTRVRVIAPPDPRLAASDKLTSGFVVEVID